jgi:hypothetical protein
MPQALNTTKPHYALEMKLPESETVQREATSIKIKPDLWKEAKIEAIKHEKTVSELVEEAIEAWMKANKKK